MGKYVCKKNCRLKKNCDIIFIKHYLKLDTIIIPIETIALIIASCCKIKYNHARPRVNEKGKFDKPLIATKLACFKYPIFFSWVESVLL